MMAFLTNSLMDMHLHTTRLAFLVSSSHQLIYRRTFDTLLLQFHKFKYVNYINRKSQYIKKRIPRNRNQSR
ncbi:hypothetical protein FGO68_gene12249 [Halteria grandinella]|uniref:Uncharacterized protein n=1 Tax=Halteria grandinella TaxID=5974 RepID=A0A8J8SY70_HALGN|nr:hypothetical protein FGO68_gene12249 [Halteria grandinella]